jgi:TRAP-type C4-dicarboxylate transport system substrate-binding protein
MARQKRAAMKKFLLILFAVILTGGLIQSSDSLAAPAKVFKLTYALFQPAAAPLSVKNTEFAKEIEKRTNGQVQITVFQGGSLLSGPAMYEGVRSGIADMGNCLTVYNPGAFPFTSIAELPAMAESGWAVSHAQYDYLAKYQPKEWADVHMITTVGDAMNIGALAMAKTPILKLEDWKGKTIRTVNPKVVTALGGTVKDVPMADVYDALSKGVIDGEVGAPEPLRAWRLADVAKHITVNAGVVQPSVLWYNIMNKDKWNSLPPDIQKTITDVGKEYSGKLGSAWDEQSVGGIEYAKSVGCTIYMLSKEEATRWSAAIMPVIDAHLKDLTTKGFTQQQVEDAWAYFKSRLEYWNGQQSQNNITPTRVRVEAFIK